MDLPAALEHGDVSAACVVQAAKANHVDPLVLLSVMRTENGRNNSESKNKNGTTDYGVMQINTIWLDELAKIGVRKEHLHNGCVNVYIGAWILAKGLKQYGQDYWRGVGRYNSNTRYPVDRNAKYAARVWKIYREYVKAVTGITRNDKEN